jgi:hypothetical protein
VSVDPDELALLCSLTGRPNPDPRVRDLPAPYARLRDRVAASMLQLAINQLRELGPVRQPTREELVRLMVSCDHDVRLLAMQLVQRSAALPV